MSKELQNLLPYGITALSLVAFLFFIARPYFSTLSTEAAKATPAAVKRLYMRLRPVGGRRLARYRGQVRDQNSRVRLGLSERREASGQSPPPGLREVYVPLQYEGDHGRGDAASRLRQAGRTVLKGAPGAGKSLLMKHEMLQWAEGGDDAQIPVMIDLYSCNLRPEDSFETLITERFANAWIRGAKEMVESRLAGGGLRIFFDGLDEVGTEHLGRVVHALRDFATRYGECEVVVSCRSAAYEGQLEDLFDQEVQIAEFDDASILRFLSKWPEFGEPAMAARIFRALQDDPELMVLARSPLMLTMIAYLQSGDRPESVGPLPNSRAAFYDMAVAHLLDRDRLLNREEAIRRYHAGRKTMVLQKLALRQLSASSSRGDRQEITRAQFEDVITELLPGFDLERDPHLQLMLTEIVQRSELIKDIDRGRHYRFAHLTLLEYLAACELRADETQLMEHYRRDPQPWRETVRMWCAVARDGCTRVVREVFQDDDPRRRVLALQCLADAVHIDQSLVEEVLGHFLGRLGAPGETGLAIAQGLGTLAASSRPRGRAVREALIDAARGPACPRRSAALRALVVSGRQEAAHALARLQDDEARSCLQDMGDVAVPSLAEEAAGGAFWAVRSLGAVATPAAAARLAELLWRPGSPDDPIARTAAWQLASLMRSPDVRNELSAGACPDDADSYHHYAWIWDAFGNDGLKALAGRIAWLMDGGRLDALDALDAPARGAERWTFDDEADALVSQGVSQVYHRLGIPLFACAGIHGHVWEDSGLYEIHAQFQAIEVSAMHGVSLDETDEQLLRSLLEWLLSRGYIAPVYRDVLAALPLSVRARLMVLRLSDVTPAPAPRVLRAKWRTVHEKPDRPQALTATAFLSGFAFLVLWFGLGGIRLAAGSFGWHPWGLAPLGPAWLGAGTIGVGALAGAVALAGDGRAAFLRGRDDLAFVIATIVLMVCAAVCFWFAIRSGADLIGWPAVVIIVSAFATTPLMAGAIAARVNDKRDNPLRAVLAAAE